MFSGALTMSERSKSLSFPDLYKITLLKKKEIRIHGEIAVPVCKLDATFIVFFLKYVAAAVFN